MEEVGCGTMAQMKDKRKKRKRGQTSTLPHLAPLDVGTKFTITFSEDKFELNKTSSQSHISPKTYAVPPACVSTRGGLIRVWNVCAIVVTVCALIDTTDCNWDMTSTSFTRRRRRRRLIGCYSTSATWTCYRLRLQRWEMVSHEHRAGTSFAEELYPSQATEPLKPTVPTSNMCLFFLKRKKPQKYVG